MSIPADLVARAKVIAGGGFGPPPAASAAHDRFLQQALARLRSDVTAAAAMRKLDLARAFLFACARNRPLEHDLLVELYNSLEPGDLRRPTADLLAFAASALTPVTLLAFLATEPD